MRLTTPVLLLALLGCSPCDDEIVDFVPSPNKQHVATVAVRGCGATTADSMVVAIHQPGTKFTDKDIVFSRKYEAAIRLSWKSESILQVDCEFCSEKMIFKKESSLDGVTVEYR